jgi:hypothetical protein
MEPIFDPKWLPRAQTQEEIIKRLKWQGLARTHYQAHPLPLALPDPRHTWPVMQIPAYSTQPVVILGHQILGRQTFAEAADEWRRLIQTTTFATPELTLGDDDKRRKNKLARKERQGHKGSQNSSGRRWWESR